MNERCNGIKKKKYTNQILMQINSKSIQKHSSFDFSRQKVEAGLMKEDKGQGGMGDHSPQSHSHRQ